MSEGNADVEEALFEPGHCVEVVELDQSAFEMLGDELVVGCSVGVVETV